MRLFKKGGSVHTGNIGQLLRTQTAACGTVLYRIYEAAKFRGRSTPFARRRSSHKYILSVTIVQETKVIKGAGSPWR